MVSRSKTGGFIESDTRNLAGWEAASLAIELVRERQSSTNAKFVGGVHIAEKLKKAIRKFIKSDAIAQAICDSRNYLEAAERLIYRFEELCRRRQVNISSMECRQYAYRRLLIDLHLNTSCTGTSPKKMVTVTLLNSELVQDLFTDKNLSKILAACPSFIDILAERNPSDLRKALNTAEERTKAVLKNPEFSLFWPWPGVVRRIVLQRGNTYEQYLRELQHRITELKNRFPGLERRPSLAIDTLTRFGEKRAEDNIIKLLGLGKNGKSNGRAFE